MAIRKLTVFAVFITLLIGIGPASVQASARIAVLVSFDNIATRQIVQAFQKYLQSRGTDVAIELYQLDNSDSKAGEASRQIKAKGADLVFAVGSLALSTASGNIPNIPVVAGMILYKKDLEEYPNTTGVVLEFPVNVQLEWILRFLPGTKNIGVLYDPSENGETIKHAGQIAQKMGLKLNAREVAEPQDLPHALQQLTDSVDVIWGLSDKTVLNEKTAQHLLLFAFRNKIPFVGLSASWVKSGAIYALDRDYQDIGEQCGEMARKVLQGAKVSSIKPEFPRVATYYLNMKTAEHMKVDLSWKLIQDAKGKF